MCTRWGSVSWEQCPTTWPDTVTIIGPWSDQANTTPEATSCETTEQWPAFLSNPAIRETVCIVGIRSVLFCSSMQLSSSSLEPRYCNCWPPNHQEMVPSRCGFSERDSGWQGGIQRHNLRGSIKSLEHVIAWPNSSASIYSSKKSSWMGAHRCDGDSKAEVGNKSGSNNGV